MRKGAIISALFIGLLSGNRAAAQNSGIGATSQDTPTISKIHVTTDGQSLNIEVSTSAPAIPDTDRLENPDRIIFDFPGFVLQGPPQHLNVNQGPVTAVRASLFQANPPITRIVLDVKELVSIELQAMENKVVIRLPYDSVTPTISAKTPRRNVSLPPAKNVSPPSAKNMSPPPAVKSPPVSSKALPAALPASPQPTSPPPRTVAPNPKAPREYDILARAQAVTLEELPGLEAKAQSGDPQAQTLLALAYHSGVLLKNDEEEALRLLRLAAEKGYLPAEESLGIYYAMGIGMEKPDPQAAIKWYTAAAQKGSVDAATNIGSMYASGDGVPKDMTAAVRWFRQAADAGNGAAAYNLALIYRRGDGVPRDDQQGLSWLTQAADHDFVPALRDIGLRSAYPRDGSAPNIDVALARLKRGVELGDAISQAILGDIFSSGELVKADSQQAATYYKMAADQGQRDGEFGLAVRYVTGDGMPKDEREALRWFTAAANQGHADAQYDVGTMYELGQGTEVDLSSALHFYKLAAQQGVVKAQYRLAILLTKGPGIETDRVSAYKWFMLSQDSIKSSATELNELRHSMSPAEIAEAEHRVDAWRNEHKQASN
jgi:TPR repeat protein